MNVLVEGIYICEPVIVSKIYDIVIWHTKAPVTQMQVT